LASYESLKNTIHAKNATTVKNFLNILEDVYLITTLSLYDFSLKKQIYNPDKYYVNDLGFYHAVGFKFSENMGKLLENVVFEQLMRKGFEFYYWKSRKGNEVDFLVKQHNKITDALQVTYSLSPENLVRETAGLDALKEQLGEINKIILTYDEEKEVETVAGRIKVMPVWKWLLE
jgi:predicted AAA+ superfamily ATPase